MSSDPTLPLNLGIRLPNESASDPKTTKLSMKLRIRIREWTSSSLCQESETFCGFPHPYQEVQVYYFKLHYTHFPPHFFNAILINQNSTLYILYKYQRR